MLCLLQICYYPLFLAVLMALQADMFMVLLCVYDTIFIFEQQHSARCSLLLFVFEYI